MRLVVLILTLFANRAFAIEAVVTVLETPLLKYRSYDAPVVQYLRKGDVIKLHPSVNNDRRLDVYAPSAEKIAEIKEKKPFVSFEEEDPIFLGNDENIAYPEDEFLPTLDRHGNTAYVIGKHLYLYYNDRRELGQKVIAKDPTDYRLQEPLLKNYPVETDSGYRGQLLIGWTQPYVESYDYKRKFRTKSYQSPIDLNYTYLREAPGKYQERLFIGASGNFRYFENSYSFDNVRIAREQGFRLGVGPTISYDAFKGEKDRINLSGTILVNFIDRMYVGQRSINFVEQERPYVGYSLSPRFNIQYHRKAIIEDVDFVLGTSLEIGTPTTYRAQTAGKDQDSWRNIGEDTYTTRTTYTLGGYIGVQSAY